MTPAPPNLVAFYRIDDERHPRGGYSTTRPVIGFDDDGVPLIIKEHDKVPYPVRADQFDNDEGSAQTRTLESSRSSHRADGVSNTRTGRTLCRSLRGD